jgi:hypothetical protein
MQHGRHSPDTAGGFLFGWFIALFVGVFIGAGDHFAWIVVAVIAGMVLAWLVYVIDTRD